MQILIDIVFLVVIPWGFFRFARWMLRDSPHRNHQVMPYVGAIGLFLTTLLAMIDK